MADTSYVNPENTQIRTDDRYGKVLDTIKQDGVCPFCPEHLKQYHTNPILKETDDWYLTTNLYPYKGARVHMLIISKSHRTHVSQLSSAAWNQLYELISYANEQYHIKGGTFIMRYGETRYTGASVAHLHAQLVASDPEASDYAPIMTRVG
jgi:diadenosine tetraphosphate (Ap4A) HIT family hydrolase